MPLRRTVLIALAASAAALLAGCASPTTPTTATSPAATSAPSPTREPAESAAPPACDDLVDPVTLTKLAANGYSLVTDWTGEPGRPFQHLKPFADRGGVVCIWGNPEYAELPWALAWSPLDAASAQTFAETFTAQGMNRAETGSGIVFSAESETHTDNPYGYLLRDGDWFFNLALPDLEPLAGRFDALQDLGG
jgi:hypothetical protein